jgi:DNA-directed RNA polymerase specialized sigma24 family protein
MQRHYVDSKKFFQAVCDYKSKLRYCEGLKLEKPDMPNYLGLCFTQIAENYSHHRWFRSYPQSIREDMIQDAVYFCVKYIDSFNPEKSKNAFAYFTQVVYHAFRQRIERERKYLATKLKAIEHVEVFHMAADKQAHDDQDYGGESNIHYSDNAKKKRHEFIESYETRTAKKKKKDI